jgi:broad specificity phosphatase PhoE
MPALYVIRHAEPAITGVILGQCDPPLSETGIRQAQNLAGLLPDRVIVYSSPLRRAYQTAEQLFRPMIILADLAEISYGKWDGMTWAQIENNWPDIARDKLQNWQEVIPPGGELWQEFRERVTRALSRVISGPLPAAIVAHEAVNAAIVQELTNAAIQSYKQQYCEIKQYDLGSGT